MTSSNSQYLTHEIITGDCVSVLLTSYALGRSAVKMIQTRQNQHSEPHLNFNVESEHGGLTLACLLHVHRQIENYTSNPDTRALSLSLSLYFSFFQPTTIFIQSPYSIALVPQILSASPSCESFSLLHRAQLLHVKVRCGSTNLYVIMFMWLGYGAETLLRQSDGIAPSLIGTQLKCH